MATWREELTHWKTPWCWERLKVGGERDDRWWDGWMASPTWWTWVWVSSRSWWWTGRPDVLQSMGLQRVGHNWATELTEWWGRICYYCTILPHKQRWISIRAHFAHEIRIFIRCVALLQRFPNTPKPFTLGNELPPKQANFQWEGGNGLPLLLAKGCPFSLLRYRMLPLLCSPIKDGATMWPETTPLTLRLGQVNLMAE